ncbi:MAG: guanylate kinase [Deltaproteobacteria bacterium]|nr:guanylate kinase [Deltaproteobacteria bacterium]
MTAKRRGLLFVVSSPSGAGKTTLCHRLMAEFPALAFSISYTTRPKRPNERDGVDYHFTDHATFSRMVAEDRFAEWAEVHGNRYGTSLETISQNIDAGLDVLFDIDWQGATQLKSKYPDETVMVFVLPPSLEELSRRLRNRGTDAPEMVARRLAKAREELGHYGEYEYLVTNDDLDQAYRELSAIYVAGHCTRRRRAHRALELVEAVRSPGEGRA